MTRDQVRGAVLGAAIGDALGYPVEFLSLASILAEYGPAGVTGYRPQQQRSGRPVALYSDDTQLAELVLRALIEGRHGAEDLDATMKRMASAFVTWSSHPLGGHRAPGGACLAGCAALARGIPWHSAGAANAGGCGSVMRAYPFGILFDGDPEKGVAWAVAHSRLTHQAPLALAACAGMTVAVAASARGESPTAVATLAAEAARVHDGETADMLLDAAERAQRGDSPEQVLSTWLGWAAHDAMAAALFVFCRHPDDFARAVLEAVNSPGDSDSLGTLVGALVGVRKGIGQIPPQWIEELERGDELLALADQAHALSTT